MEATLQWFVHLLRARGVRVSVPETIDAIRCAGQPGVLTDRGRLRWALRAALVKDQRDAEVFGELFDAFFGLVRIGSAEQQRTGVDGEADIPDDLGSYAGEWEELTLSGLPSQTAGSQGARPEDVRHLFDTDNLASRFNLTEDEGMIDLSAPTEEIAFSQGNQVVGSDGYRIQLDAQRLRSGGAPGQLAGPGAAGVDAGLTLDEQEALLRWLGPPEDDVDAQIQAATVVGDLSEAVRRHAQALLALERRSGQQARRRAPVEDIGSAERAELEATLRRLARSLHGARTHRRTVAPAGRVDAARTMRRSMRFDGVPFTPVTVRSAEDRPRVVVLADVSLSVRATAHFMLTLVHSLQDMFARVQSFAFVADVVETTALFAEQHAESALGLLFGGDLIDLDANSDYGAVFRQFVADHAHTVNRRTTLLILGDGRNNGNDPGLADFADLTRRARETIWLTPEPRYSWRLGGCDMPAYAELCDRVQVVRGLRELGAVAEEFTAPGVRR
ncbi:VWA domain-containing protein [Nocardia farcinica]|uniref:Uncharacterized protein conserved in bacteria n=1 Tax=Nocardia farcinica TaxID=37329 RepID=A0A449HC40_NOCFR|nr:VWA domain-containing protein [Nocardia farcinica]MBF6523517.1 VWA domain-containing protein [Nocardia farcinica]VFA95569.1 Uncharacterized protein conserved in bacteria [Nocardia farcinica]